MAVDTVTITGKVLRPDGQPATVGSITCELVAPGSALDGSTWQRIGGSTEETIGVDGSVSFGLVPNDSLVPAGTAYRCTFQQRTTGHAPIHWVELWQLATTPDPIDVGAIVRLDAIPGYGIYAPTLIPGIGIDGSESMTIATGSTTARTLKDRFAEVANVKDFGAAGDGTTDDTAAFQAALVACYGVADPASNIRPAIRSLFIPDGNYRLKNRLEIWSVAGLTIRGQSKLKTLLAFDGTLGGAYKGLIDLNGTSYCTFSDFTIARYDSSMTGDVAIHVYWGYDAYLGRGTAYGNSTQNTFERILISAKVKCGVALGDYFNNGNGYQVDASFLDKIGVYGDGVEGWGGGYYQHAFKIGNGYYSNILTNSGRELQVHWYRYGLHVSGTGFTVDSFEHDNGESVFVAAGAWGYFGVRGGRAEGCARLIYGGGGGATAVSQMTVQDYQISGDGLTVGGDAIQWSSGGCLRLLGLEIFGSTDTHPAFNINTDGSGLRATVIIQGAVFASHMTLAGLFSNLAGIAYLSGVRFVTAGVHYQNLIIGADAFDLFNFVNAAGAVKHHIGFVGATSGDQLEIKHQTGTGRIVVGTDGVAFNGGAVYTRPSITGSKGGNAALGNLLYWLNLIGLITDNTA